LAVVHLTARTLDRTISQPATVGLFLIGRSMTVKPGMLTNNHRAIRLLSSVCGISGARTLVDDARIGLARHGVIAAVQRHDTAAIFDWLIDTLSYQGVSDSIAYRYMEQHGRVRWQDIAAGLSNQPSCEKLTGYWLFEDCGNRKAADSCANPQHRANCPLPRHDLRNGRLNQTAYSLFFFMRNLAGGDITGWIDNRLAGVHPAPAFDRPARLRRALLEPLGYVYGVSNKVLSMALAELLLGGDAKRPAWIEAGAVMIAVDTLVHNFLHRTGILRDFGAGHPYGMRCYAPDGCATIIEHIAGHIDARQFNPAFPANFPRFVQHAIWRFCAEAGLNRCNGRRIDDRASCAQAACPLFKSCARVPLKSA
jgi:hypothetical protein